MAAAASARKHLYVLSDAMEGVAGECSDVLRYLSADGLDDYYRAFEEVVYDELNDFWPRYNSLTEAQTRQLATHEQTAQTDAFVHMVAKIHACIGKNTLNRLNKLCEKYEHSSDPKKAMLKKFCQVKSWPATRKGLDVIKKLIAIAHERDAHTQRREAERVRASQLAAAEAERVRASELAAAAAAAEAAREQRELALSMPRDEDRRLYEEMMAQQAQLKLLEQKKNQQNEGGKRRNKSHKKRSYRKRSHRKRSH
jgi:hypothetical protein